MKKSLLIVATICITLLSTPIFAQADPGADPDAAAAPIDNYVWVLALIGLFFVFMKFRAIQKNSIQN